MSYVYNIHVRIMMREGYEINYMQKSCESSLNGVVLCRVGQTLQILIKHILNQP